jgi:hypothetical protein
LVEGGLQQIAVTWQERVKSGEVIVYTGTVAKATTCGRRTTAPNQPTNLCMTTVLWSTEVCRLVEGAKAEFTQ